MFVDDVGDLLAWKLTQYRGQVLRIVIQRAMYGLFKTRWDAS